MCKIEDGFLQLAVISPLISRCRFPLHFLMLLRTWADIHFSLVSPHQPRHISSLGKKKEAVGWLGSS